MSYLKSLRKEKGLTQMQIAKRLGFSSPQYLSNVERNLSKLCAKHFKPIAKMLSRTKSGQKKIVESLISERLKAEEKEIRKIIG